MSLKFINDEDKPMVGLVGYYGFGNYGDEYFGRVLTDRMHNVKFRVLDDVYSNGDVNAERVKEIVDRCDAIVVGGGDLIIPFSLSPLYWRKEYLERPVHIYGVGVPRWGGYQESVVNHMSEFMRSDSVKSITARDEESANWIRKYIKPSVDVHHEPDIVCAFRHSRIIRDPNIFGLVLRYQSNGINNSNVKWICEQVSKKGMRIKIIILGSGISCRDDLTAVAKLDLPDCDIIIRQSLSSLSDELLSCGMLASQKFHGCVVAMAHDIPCYGLSMANKFINFYELINRPDWVTELGAIDLRDKFSSFIRSPDFEFPESIRNSSIEGIRRLEERIISGLR